MSTINKICLFGGNFVPEGWAKCDGENASPNLPGIVYSSYEYEGEKYEETMNYICCINDDNSPEEAFLGQIVPFAGGFAPRSWHFCDGKEMSIRSSTALFSILGTRYGGDGMNTFALPSIKDTHSEGERKHAMHYIICVEGRFPMRS